MQSFDYKDLTVDRLDHATRMPTVNHQDWKLMSTVENVSGRFDYHRSLCNDITLWMTASVHKVISLAERSTDGWLHKKQYSDVHEK